ncbi:alpha/beta fold hydrolase [Micromonospora olivasterospora]|uniref:Thioesterase domain-containing protein n=1 Tax=Micromonospora olivasterospora TaxID=1880 RepID=A0A562IAG8_MICOL|nr:alpha/beta fold hydrolase [Micromonospora olivasterospora]TWH68019.1 thioesterase domain-containing protein [Micromonospora olivasterospora]
MLPDVLVPLGADGDGPPLYCVHSATGSCYTYLALAGALDHRPVVGIEAVGYDGDEVVPASLADLADHYAQVVDADRKGRPVCLLGWSMGGVVALEMAERLRALGCLVPLVVLVDARVPEEEPMPADRLIRARFVAAFAPGALGDISARSTETLRVWAENGSGEDGWEPLRARGWLPDELDSETLNRRFEVFRNNVRALNQHRVAPGHPGPVLVIKAKDSPPESRRWSELADDVREVTVPGDHHSLWHDAGLSELTRSIRDALRQVSATRARGYAS